MNHNFKIANYAKALLLSSVSLGVFTDSFAASAQDKHLLTLRVNEVIQQIENTSAEDISARNGPVVNISDAQTFEARDRFHDELAERDSEKMLHALDQYSAIAQRSGIERDIQIISNLATVAKYAKPGFGKDINHSKVLALLENNFQKQDWYVAFDAKSLSVFLHAQEGERAKALNLAEDALNLIPNDQSSHSNYARIRITAMIAHLHNLQGHLELALEATSKLVSLQQEAGQDVNRIELLNNLLFAAGVWRDNDIRTQISNALIEAEKDSVSTTPGLTQLRLAELENDIGGFNQALQYAEEAIAKTTISSVEVMALRQKAIALAGQSKTTEARAVLTEIGEIHLRENLLTETVKENTLFAEALIALNSGDIEFGTKLMNRRIDLHVQHILQTNSRDTTAMLATLENSRERQIERKAAYEREKALQAQTIAKQRKLNRLLLILLGGLGLSLIAATAFARYRGRVSKELEIKTRQAESADRMKSEFLGMISHELRTPLNGIIGIADLMTSQGPDADVRRKSSIILDSGNKLFSLVESIIDMSRIESDQMEIFPEPVNLLEIGTDVVEDWTAQVQATNKPVTFTAHLDPALDKACNTDPMRVQQCLNIMLSNAVKFTDRGRVHLHITAAPMNGEMLMQAIVADTGAGISDEVQSKLFTPFLQADSSMTRKHNGSGLSLAIARSLARMMGGDLTLVSRQGRGSEFTLSLKMPLSETSTATAPAALPIIAPEPVIAANPPTSSDVIDLMVEDETTARTPLHHATETLNPEQALNLVENLTGVNVLIVEDIPFNQDIIRMLLEPEGCVCFTANDGADALRVLQVQDIDVVLMDIRMPGMDGMDATRAVRSVASTYQHVPIIALTADASAETNAACMAAGADIFLTKPVLANELIESIEYLRAHRRVAGNRSRLMLRKPA